MPRLDFAYAGIKFKSSYFNMVLKGDYKNMINNERLSGILLHPTSLPSLTGLGILEMKHMPLSIFWHGQVSISGRYCH